VSDGSSFFSYDGPVEIVAHRGFSELAPENTVAALELALQAGADAVEFDLHTSADGTPVLLHDDTLERTTDGYGPVATLSLETLRDLDAGSWFSRDFAGEPVPPLAEALEAIGDRVGRVYAEVKGSRDPDDVRTMVDVVHDAGLSERTVFISMDWDALDRIRAHDAHALVGYIVEDVGRAGEAYERAAGDERALLDFDCRILLSDPPLAARAVGAGIALATWTVNAVDDAERLLEMGVPRITTNRVSLLKAWKDGL
jgi:glycerophosphoryl diester phosphodiesterase